MTDTREIIAHHAWGPLDERHATADIILDAIEVAGYRILSPDDVDPVTLDRAELACFHQQSKIHDRKRTDWDRGNDSAVNGCIAAIRALGRKA